MKKSLSEIFCMNAQTILWSSLTTVYRFSICLVFCIMVSGSVRAQFTSPQTLSPSDAWEIIFTLPVSQRAYLLAEFKDSNGKILLIARSENVQLNAGQNSFTKELIRTTKLDYKDSEVQKSVNQTGNFPKGKYIVCTKIMDVQTQSQLEIICRDYEVGDPLLMKDTKKPLGMIDFYGSASIESNYMNPNSYYTQYPNSFIRADAEQGIQLYGIPISLQGRYTTEKQGLSQDVNMFRINFDKNRFEAKAKEIILRKLAETQLQKVSKYSNELQTLTEIENVEQMVKDQALQLVQEKIKNIEADLRLYAAENTEGGRKKYEEAQKLYKRLLREKKKLEDLKQRYDQLMSLKKQWVDSGKWQELQNLAYNPPDISDPKVLLSQLKKYGLFNGVNKYLYSIEELTLGSAFPTFSPLTLNGIQVNGGSVKYNPGALRLAATGGKIQSYTGFNDFLPEGRFEQNLVAARVGLGQEYGSSINFSVLRFQDAKSNTIGISLLPENAWVGGTDFLVSIGKSRILEWSGEVAGLALNQNTNDTIRNSFQLGRDLNEGVINTNLSTNFDFAASSGLALNLFNGLTNLTAKGQFVGPGFNHPGAFGLRNDVLRKDFRFTQRSKNRAVDLGLQYTEEDDNFSNSKGYTTNMRQMGINLGLNSSKIVSIKLQLSNILLNSQFYEYNSNLANVTLSKSWNKSKLFRGNTVLNVALYQTKTDSIAQNINSSFINLSQNINVKSFFIILAGQYSHNATSIFSATQSGVNASIGTQIKKIGKIQVGAMYNQVSKDDYRLGFTCDIQAQLIKNMTFSLRAFYNDYSQYPQLPNGRQEQILQGSIRYQW